MKRRQFLLAGAGATAGLAVAFLPGCAQLPVIPQRPEPTAERGLAWIRWLDGRYLLTLPCVEMGQQIATALKQLACEELGIAWSDLALRLPDSRSVPALRATVGSDSVRLYLLPLAQACATLREARAAGLSSGQLQARAWPLHTLRVHQALQRARLLGPGGRSAADGVADAGFGTIGGSPEPAQGQALVRGQALFVADQRRPGQLYGRVLRAPCSPALRSRPSRWDEAAARAIPGFVTLRQEPGLTLMGSQGLGIVARTPAGLDRIAAALDLQWQIEDLPALGFDSASLRAQLDIDARLAGGRALGRRLHDDEVDRHAGGWDLDLRIDTPLAAHASIETRAALAEFRSEGELHLWAGSQDPFYIRDVLARRLSLAPERIRVQACRIGGAFGGRTLCTVELEAAVLARAAGAPVKVQWTRAQELQQGHHRPPSSHRLRARLSGGRLRHWWHAFSSSHIMFTNAAMPRWLQALADLGGDPGVARGAELPYRTQSRRCELDVLPLPVFTGPWRGLGAGPNGFAIESAIDECARRAGADPLQFRIDHAEDARLVRLLRHGGRVLGWSARRPASPAGAPDGRLDLRLGSGLACGIYKGSSYVLVMAELELLPPPEADPTGLPQLRMRRLSCVHDCGLVINPDAVRAQCEGNLVWGLGMVLGEELMLADSAIAASGFVDTPIPRMSQIPPLEVHLLNEGEAPSGAGETAIVAAAAAVANALRDACGLRLNRLPLQAELLRAATRRFTAA